MMSTKSSAPWNRSRTSGLSRASKGATESTRRRGAPRRFGKRFGLASLRELRARRCAAWKPAHGACNANGARPRRRAGASAGAACHSPPMLRWGAAAYALLGILALLLVNFWRGGSPLVHPDPWLVLEPAARHVYSALWGLAFGGLLVVCTRVAVTRYGWARDL